MAKSAEELIAKQLKKQKIRKPQKRRQGGGKKTGTKKQTIITKTKKSILSKIQARSNRRIRMYKAQLKKAKQRREQDKNTSKYFRKKRTETQAQKERRLAKGYLTRKINKLEKGEQSAYTKNLISELKKTRELIDKTYKDVRKMQSLEKVKAEQKIVDIVWNVEYYAEYVTDEDLALQVENILVDKTEDEINDMIFSDDKLLWEISNFPDTTFWHATEEEQRNDLENFERTVMAFIQKYKNK